MTATAENPVVLVTGASRGLGREIARRFGRAGWNVVVNCVRSVEAAEAAADEIRETGSDAVVVQADVAEPSAPGRLIGTATERWGRLDCVVNNAAVARDDPLLRLSDADWDAVVATDLFAPMRLARRAGEAMPPRSSVVNVVSICGLWGCAGAPAYSAAKAALAGFTQGAAAVFAARGLRINAVAPGYLATDMGAAAPAAMEAARAQHAMGTLSEPRAAAEFIVRLTQTPAITGQVFVLDGRVR